MPKLLRDILNEAQEPFMVPKSVKRVGRVKHYEMTPEEAKHNISNGHLRGAGLYEVQGPQWKDIYWAKIAGQRRPYVLKK